MVNVDDAVKARELLRDLMVRTHCEPILVRLAWHDAGTYDKNVNEPWPKPGGVTASIRLKLELSHGANAGLNAALGLLQPIRDAVPALSWSDLFQLGSAVAVQHAGGPFIPLRLGRLDAVSEADCTPDGRLPDAAAPFNDGATSPGQHLRNKFARMGLTDQDIVVLSGAHTVGRARPDRSGFGKASTKYTEKGPGNPGGQSWTVEWLKFDNSYFTDIKEQRDADLLVLPTDAVLFEDEGFRPLAEKYALDQDAFFQDYVTSALKLSELGAKWDDQPAVLPE